MRRTRIRSSPPLAVEASIRSLAPGGDGVAHLDVHGERRTVFVPRSAPGDRARLAVDPSGRPARGRVLELIAGGTDRVPVACRWADRCGGCDWMHLSLEAQERVHAEHVRAALPSRWRDIAIQSTPAPAGLGVRSRARVHVRCNRGGRATVGMHEARTHSPVEVDECLILEAPIERARSALPSLFEGASGRAEVTIASGVGGRPVLHVQWIGAALPALAFSRLEQAVERGDLAGAQILLEGASRPARIGDPTPWTTGADGSALQLTSGGFAQANTTVNVALARHVADLATRARVGRAVELYAGSGNLGIVLAPAVGELVCVESNRECCEAARTNFATRGLRARVVEADAEGYAWKVGTELVALDPPRTGARTVAERLASSRIAHIIYVSCDPQTLGRDLAALEAAYNPASVHTFEMFPQTSHVETVVALERRR